MSIFKPILFSTPMVKAILDGRKTMTRRKIKNKDQPFIQDSDCEIELNETWGWVVMRLIENDPIRYEILQQFKCPYGEVGDILWVRETFFESGQAGYYYKANYKVDSSVKWKPSIFMPKAACRIFLEITDVRVERLQEISEEDAINEGIEQTFFGEIFNAYKNYINDGQGSYQPIGSFKSLWQSINGNWEENPFVWVVEFKKIDKPTDFN